MKIGIYQINTDRDSQRLKFMGLDFTRQKLRTAEPDCSAYDKVFSGDVRCGNLEDVFTLFNTSRPKNFRGHSLSVSDVVEVEDAASITPASTSVTASVFGRFPSSRSLRLIKQKKAPSGWSWWSRENSPGLRKSVPL